MTRPCTFSRMASIPTLFVVVVVGPGHRVHKMLKGQLYFLSAGGRILYTCGAQNCGNGKHAFQKWVTGDDSNRSHCGFHALILRPVYFFLRGIVHQIMVIDLACTLCTGGWDPIVNFE